MKFATKAAVIRISVGIAALVGMFMYLVSGFGRIETKTPAVSVFASETGIEIGANWKLIVSGDEHVGFVGDGETYFVFRVPPAEIQKLLASAAPWSAKWKAGPVEHEVGFHCKFDTAGVGYGSSIDGLNEYSGDPTLVSLLSSDQIRYAAKERCCDSLRWHNGHLLIVDPVDSKVWLSIWDF